LDWLLIPQSICSNWYHTLQFDLLLLTLVLGPSSALYPTLKPAERPTKIFYGNSVQHKPVSCFVLSPLQAHSQYSTWSASAAIYTGGNLYLNSSNNLLWYWVS
jgi:hypothetical protein